MRRKRREDDGDRLCRRGRIARKAQRAGRGWLLRWCGWCLYALVVAWFLRERAGGRRKAGARTLFHNGQFAPPRGVTTRRGAQGRRNVLYCIGVGCSCSCVCLLCCNVVGLVILTAVILNGGKFYTIGCVIS